MSTIDKAKLDSILTPQSSKIKNSVNKVLEYNLSLKDNINKIKSMRSMNKEKMKFQASSWYFLPLESRRGLLFPLGTFSLNHPSQREDIEKANVLSGFLAFCTSSLDYDMLPDFESAKQQLLLRWLEGPKTQTEGIVYFKMIEEDGKITKVEFYLASE